MALLPQIQYPDIRGGLAAAGQGYALGQDMRAQNALSVAGNAMAKGDQTGARNALYQAGQMREGMQIDDRMRAAAKEARQEQLAKAARSNEVLGNLAMRADTPEKWAVAIDAAKRAGLQVDNWADFGTRDFVLAQAGKVKEFLDLELKERALAAKDSPFKVISKGGRVFDERTQQFIEPEGGADPADRIEGAKFEQGLRKEFAALSKDYRSIQEGADRVRVGASLNNGVGDLSLIFGYMKLLDPGSVVREGEFANAENAQGVPDRIRNTWNKIMSGERLNPKTREEFVAAATALAKEQQQRQERIIGQFRGISEDAGVDPGRVIMDFGANAPPTPDAAVGTGVAPQPDPRAVRMLESDPSPEAIREFEEIFGPGSAQRALGR